MPGAAGSGDAAGTAPAAATSPPRSESFGMFSTQSLPAVPSLTVTCPLAVVNSNMLTSICHTPGVSSSV